MHNFKQLNSVIFYFMNNHERIFYDFIREVRMKVDSTLSAERSSSTNGEDPLSMRATYRERKGKINHQDKGSRNN